MPLLHICCPLFQFWILVCKRRLTPHVTDTRNNRWDFDPAPCLQTHGFTWQAEELNHFTEMANTLSLQLGYTCAVTGELFSHFGASKYIKQMVILFYGELRYLRRVPLLFCLWGGRVPRENEEMPKVVSLKAQDSNDLETNWSLIKS